MKCLRGQVYYIKEPLDDVGTINIFKQPPQQNHPFEPLSKTKENVQSENKYFVVWRIVKTSNVFVLDH